MSNKVYFRKFLPLIFIVQLLLTSCSMGMRHSEIINGEKYSYVVNGVVSPTIIFESGLGDGLESWNTIYKGVSEFSTALAYSRPGYSGNIGANSINSTTTANDAARRLNSLLQRIDIGPPYVLVGHSVGGLYLLRFAQLYPEQVAGIVLVDGRPKQFRFECESAGLSPCAPPDEIAKLSPPHIGAEIRGLLASENQAPEPGVLGSIPVTVIAATEHPPGAPYGAQAIWLRVQEELSNSLQSGKFVVADGSGHYIHHDAPQLVLEEIRSMIESINNYGMKIK